MSRSIINPYVFVTSGGPWDISGASFNNNFDVSGENTGPTGIFITADGLKMYVTEFATEAIYQYTLSSAWDISTATYDSKSFAVTAQADNAQGVWVSTDGTRMLVATSDAPARILEYDLSTPFDVSTASFTTSLNVSAQTTNPRDVFFRADGKKMYTVLTTGNRPVLQYSLSTAYDLSTASYDSVLFDTNSETATIVDVFFKPDGLKMFVCEADDGLIFQYTLSSAWNVSTATYDGVSFDTGSGNQGALFFKSDGTVFYIVDAVLDEARAFNV